MSRGEHRLFAYIVAAGCAIMIGAILLTWHRWRLHDSDQQPNGTVGETRTEVPVHPERQPSGFAFEDVAQTLGIDFEYFRGDTGKLWTIEPHGGGVASLDFDGDRLEDLFFVNGKQLPPDPSDHSQVSRLYRNRYPGAFEDVTNTSKLMISVYGQGCTSGDYDNDGFADLLVTGWHECLLWHNNGDGTFSDVTVAAEVVRGRWNTGTCFADFNRDGNLDFFVAGYLHFDPASHKPCVSKDIRIGYCGPHHYAADDDVLLWGTGDGLFQDISEQSGILLPRGSGFGGVAADVDNDGWPDLLVANDAEPNFLFHNQAIESDSRPIRFADVAVQWGIALNGNGLPEANMGIACGDYDGNGFLDFGISHFYQEHFTLYQNLGPRGFRDVTQSAGLDYTTRSKMGWGTGFVDLDSDGWLDLFVVNGHVNDHPDSTTPYRMTAQVFRNDVGERFLDVSDRSGPYFREPRIGRGTSVVDFDNNGRPDLVVVHHHDRVSILANRTATTHHVLGLRLVGTNSNRDATNARAVATLRGAGLEGADRQLMREYVSGEGYLGRNDKRQWFGLGERTEVEVLDVRWPSGRTDTFSNIVGDREYLLIEGQPLRCIGQY